jgi:hypothetical protein
VIVAALLALVAGATVPEVAVAASDPVEEYLLRYPGGTRINATEISYGGGVFIVTVTRASGIQASPDCPSGWFCFYDDINYGYPRGKLSSCGWQDLAWWSWHDRTESVHYNLATGSVSFINHAPGTGHGSDTRLFDVSSGASTLSDVSPYRNMADHVYRFC